MSEFILEMKNISKTFGKLSANKQINFNVRRGTIHGLAGENGAGKSTLMKILFGLEEVDDDTTSEIRVNGDRVRFHSPVDAIAKGIGMVQQHFAIAEQLTALENIILGSEPSRFGVLKKNAALTDLERIAQKNLSVPWSHLVCDLPVAMQQRLEILKLLYRRADILILDEPTAVLSPPEVVLFFDLLRCMREEGKTIVIITHKLNELVSLCDEVTVLRNGRVTATLSKSEISKENLIKGMIGRPLNPPAPAPKSQSDEICLEVLGLTVESSERERVCDLNFGVYTGEILGVAGVAGNGQQTLIDAILGHCSYSGTINYLKKPLPQNPSVVREEFNFGLIAEDRHQESVWLDGTLSDNFRIGLNRKLKPSQVAQKARHLAETYHMKFSSFNEPIKNLSGGNQQKLVVARELGLREPRFLLASQPSRGVDIAATEIIHSKILELKKRGGSALLVSSELEELCALSDRILVLFEGRSVAIFSAPFDFGKIGLAMTSGKTGA